MKKTITILFLIISGIANCYSQENQIAKEVSLEKVILKPKKADKKYISVKGYVKFDKNGSRIFVSKEDFENNNVEKSIFFMFLIERSTYPTVERCDGKHVILTGMYNYDGVTNNSENTIELKNGILSSVHIKLVERN